MAIALERTPAAVAFAEPLDEFSVRATGASVFDDKGSWEEGRKTFEFSTGGERWYMSLLLRVVERLRNQQVRGVNREPFGLQNFREQLQRFLRSSFKQQAEQRSDLLASIGSSSVPTIYLHEVVRQCTIGGGPNGFDLAIDFLSHFNAELLEVFESFLIEDRPRWLQATAADHVNDNVCYILLRALARSQVDSETKLDLISDCLSRGTSSIREAATHALGDLGGDAAKRLLERAAEKDSDSLVRESAQEALDDLDA